MLSGGQGNANLVSKEFPEMREIGKACSATLPGAYYMPLAHHLVVQSWGEEGTAFVIQYHEYEKISQVF